MRIVALIARMIARADNSSKSAIVRGRKHLASRMYADHALYRERYIRPDTHHATPTAFHPGTGRLYTFGKLSDSRLSVSHCHSAFAFRFFR